MSFTPIQVARRANCAVQSIRNWSRDYAEFLSPGARGEAGPRLYSDEDVSILCAVAALRKSGVARAEVVARLREEVPGVVDVEATPQPTQATRTAQNEALALYAAQSGLQSRVEALERRMEGHTDRLVTGIILGMALTLLVVALVLRVV